MTLQKRSAYGIASILLFVGILFVWQVSAIISSKFQFFFASPFTIAEALVVDTVSGLLRRHLYITALETVSGFLIGTVSGFFAGFLLWYSPAIARVFRPYILIAGAVPIFAFAPIVILWFGTGLSMKIALSAFGTFLICLGQSYEGARNVDLTEYKLLKVYGASRLQILRKVILPVSLSWVLASMKLSIGVALLGAFIGEFISASSGIGYYMLRSGSLYDVASVFAGGLYMVLLSLAFHFIVGYIGKRRMRIIELAAVSAKVRKISGV